MKIISNFNNLSMYSKQPFSKEQPTQNDTENRTELMTSAQSLAFRGLYNQTNNDSSFADSLKKAIKKSDVDSFEALLTQSDIELNGNNIDLTSLLETLDKLPDAKVRIKFLDILQAKKDKQVLEQIKDNIDKTGMPSLELLKKYLQYPNIKGIINEPLNKSGERLAHYIAEIQTTPNNTDDASKILESFMQANPDLNIQDDNGVTPLMKALNNKNDFIASFFQNNDAEK